MTWFKVDDGLHSHRKVLAIPRSGRAAAMGLWVLAGAWSADNLTDGRIPAYMVAELGCTARNAQHLVTVNLWIEVDGDYQFHAWTEPGRQPTRAEIEANREAERKRKAEYRSRMASQRDNDRSPSGTDNGTPTGVRTPRPDPTRPDPVVPSELPTDGADKPPPKPRRSRVQDDFEITDGMRAWAATNVPGIDIEAETAQFLDYHAGKGTVMADWTRTWHTWMRNARKFAARGNGHQPAASTVRLDPSAQDYTQARL